MVQVEEEKLLPFSAGRYKLSATGSALNALGEILETQIIDGVKNVHLDWVLGSMFYEVGLIVVVVVYGVKLPPELWKNIEILYDDSDKTNASPNNVSYRFKNGPLEVAHYPGFYHIPYYTQYAVSRSGEILNLNTGLIRNSWMTTKPIAKKNIKGGYRLSWADKDYGKGNTLSRHRAMGLAFIRYDRSPLILVMNHKDGIPGNDAIDNLEWVTRAQNNQHAIDSGLTPNSVIKILMKNLHTGEVKSYPSVSACSKESGIEHSSIMSRLRKNTRRHADGIVFKKDDDTPWPELENRILVKCGAFSIVSRNVFTKETKTHASIDEASKVTGINQASIRLIANKEYNHPIREYIFRFEPGTGEILWPTHTEKQLLIYKQFPKNPYQGIGVLVKDDQGKEIGFYGSINEAAKAYGVSYCKIHRLCTKSLPAKKIEGNNFSLFHV